MGTVKKTGLLQRDKRFSFSNITVLLLSIFVFVILALTTDTFLSGSNLYSIIYGLSFQAIASIGFTYLMVMGEIDLSVGSIYCFSGAFVGILMMRLDLPLILALLIALLICAGIGLFVGFIVARLRLNSMMITLGLMSVFKGLSNMAVSEITKAYPSAYREIVKLRIADVHWTIILMVAAAVILELLLYNSSIFKKMFIVGQNIETAKIYGIKAERLKMIAFMVSTFCAGLGGILAGSRVGSPQIETGEGLEFTLVTACVLGGASLFGGKGSILRTFIGLLFLSLLTNGMIIYGIEPVAQQLVIGIILIISVFIDTKLNSDRY